MRQSQTLYGNSITVDLGPLGFHKYARDFYSAAQKLEVDRRFSPVPYYLYCRCLELTFKAVLLANGWKVKKLKRKVGHDLLKGLERTAGMGLNPVSDDDRQEIRKANEYYVSKRFEYFNTIKAVMAYPELPDLARLRSLCLRLLESAKPICERA